MKKLLGLIAAFSIVASSVVAGDIKIASDNELAGVSAQGFVGPINFNMANMNLGIMGNQIAKFKLNNHIVDSLIISGDAQKNAFMPINNNHSASNVTLNMVFVMNSTIKGDIKISNNLRAILTNNFLQ